MKMRNSFVSNSSSSSFVVAFPKRPKTINECHEIMFPNGEEFIQPYDSGTSSKKIAKTVFEDIENQEAATLEEIAERFNSRYYYWTISSSWGCYDDRTCWGTDKAQLEKIADLAKDREKTGCNNWKEEQQLINEMAKIDAKAFIVLTKKQPKYCFSYSDNDGSYSSILEHGDIFENLVHVKISHH